MYLEAGPFGVLERHAGLSGRPGARVRCRAGRRDVDGDSFGRRAVGAVPYDNPTADRGAVFVMRGGVLGPESEPSVMLPGAAPWICRTSVSPSCRPATSTRTDCLRSLSAPRQSAIDELRRGRYAWRGTPVTGIGVTGQYVPQRPVRIRFGNGVASGPD